MELEPVLQTTNGSNLNYSVCCILNGCILGCMYKTWSRTWYISLSVIAKHSERVCLV